MKYIRDIKSSNEFFSEFLEPYIKKVEKDTVRIFMEKLFKNSDTASKSEAINIFVKEF